MSSYMSVYELNEEQLSELKSNWFWDTIDYCVDETEVDPRDYGYPDNIPDELVKEHYKDICFVNDDFFCTAGKE